MLCDLGATDEQLADFFDVCIATIRNWKTDYPEFLAALKVGKEEPDERVKRSLYQRAVGYTFEAVKVFMPAGATEPVYAHYREHCPPDTAAAFIWLKNRCGWRDRFDHELTGKDGGAIKTDTVLNITFVHPKEERDGE